MQQQYFLSCSVNVRYYIGFFILTLLLACSKRDDHSNEISKIELVRTGAWSQRAATTIIDSSLVLGYWNVGGEGEHIKKGGYFVGKITAGFWDTLNLRIEKLSLKTIKPEIYLPYRDGSFFELVIHWRNHKRSIMRDYGVKQDSVVDFLKWLDKTYQNVHLQPTSKILKFETSYHNLPINTSKP